MQNCKVTPDVPIISDLTVACRGLRRSPAFTLAAIVTLALGIGANTTMFSVVNAVLLRPLPGYQTDRLERICGLGRDRRCNFLPAEVYQRLRVQLHSFSTVAANQNCRMNLTGVGEPEQLNGPCTTSNWFELHRARPLLGRTFYPMKTSTAATGWWCSTTHIGSAGSAPIGKSSAGHSGWMGNHG